MKRIGITLTRRIGMRQGHDFDLTGGYFDNGGVHFNLVNNALQIYSWVVKIGFPSVTLHDALGRSSQINIGNPAPLNMPGLGNSIAVTIPFNQISLSQLFNQGIIAPDFNSITIDYIMSYTSGGGAYQAYYGTGAFYMAAGGNNVISNDPPPIPMVIYRQAAAPSPLPSSFEFDFTVNVQPQNGTMRLAKDGEVTCIIQSQSGAIIDSAVTNSSGQAKLILASSSLTIPGTYTATALHKQSGAEVGANFTIDASGNVSSLGSPYTINPGTAMPATFQQQRPPSGYSLLEARPWAGNNLKRMLSMQMKASRR